VTWPVGCIVAAVAAVWVVLSAPALLLMYSACVIAQREDERQAAAWEAMQGGGE
jgi:hypothetical protein